MADADAETLQAVLKPRSNTVEWSELQYFLTWLMCQPSRVKCPLELRQGRSRARNNVVVAVPYLDSDFIMDDLGSLQVLLNSTTSGAFFRLKAPFLALEEGTCTVMRKLLFMNLSEEVTFDSGEARSVQHFLLRDEELDRHGYPTADEFGDLCSSPSELSSPAWSDMSQEDILLCIRANLQTPRTLCKRPAQLDEAFTRYQSTAFTRHIIEPIHDSRSTAGDGGGCVADVEDDGTFRFSDELIQQYALLVHRLRHDSDIGKMFAMDCEMVSTTKGTKLARITVVDPLLNVVLDALVKPDSPVTNYRTLYSGLTAKMLEKVTVSQADVKSFLNRIIDGETTLVGHSLNFDLRSCEITHRKVLDTALMYSGGNPGSKPSLVALAQQRLKVDLKRDHGHDSFTDSAVTMYLAIVGISELVPFRNYRTAVLGRTAFTLMSSGEEAFTHPQVRIIDALGRTYESRLGDGFVVECPDDDNSAVNLLVERMGERDEGVPQRFYFLVLRDFQRSCIINNFQDNKEKKPQHLTKRLPAKNVSSYIAQFSESLDRVISCLEHNDMLLVSNLTGDVSRTHMLWRALNPQKARHKLSRLELFWNVYRMARPDDKVADPDLWLSKSAPDEVFDMVTRSMIVCESILRREYEVAMRHNTTSWLVVLSKQASKRRRSENGSS